MGILGAWRGAPAGGTPLYARCMGKGGRSGRNGRFAPSRPVSPRIALAAETGRRLSRPLTWRGVSRAWVRRLRPLPRRKIFHARVRSVLRVVSSSAGTAVVIVAGRTTPSHNELTKATRRSSDQVHVRFPCAVASGPRREARGGNGESSAHGEGLVRSRREVAFAWWARG